MGILDVFRGRQPLEQKFDYTEALLMPLQLSGPGFGRSYAQAVANSYESNSIAHRAIRMIAENLSAIPWVLYQGDEIVDRHWILDTLKRPNPSMPGRMFMQLIAGDIVTSGETFIHKNQPRPEMQAEITPLRPDWIKIHSSRTFGDPPRYEYRPPSADPVMYDADEILHIHTLDLLRTGRGFSSIYATAMDLDQSNLSGKWNVSLLRNGGRPSMVVIAKSRLNPEQKQMLRDSVEEMHAGSGNAGRVAVFSGSEMEIKDAGFSPKDMDWREGVSEVNSRIATGLGVPPELLNLGQTTYNNRSEARTALYEDLIVPMFGMIVDGLNSWLVPEGLYLTGYWEKVEALQPNRSEEYERINKAFEAGWITINDARQEVGFDPDLDVGDLYKWQAESSSLGGPAPPERSDRDVLLDQKFDFSLEDEKSLYWKAQDDRKRDFEAALARQLGEAFDEERREIQSEIEGVTNAEQMSDLAVSVVDPDRLSEVLMPAYVAILEDFGRVSLAQLGEKSREVKSFEDVFGQYTSEVLDFVSAEVAKTVVQVSDTVKQQIRDRIAKGVIDGLSIPNIAESIDELYLEQIIPNRSTVIARTETIKASNAGSHSAAKSTGLPIVHSWLATRDDRVRPEHLEAEINPLNQRVPLDQGTFSVAGENLLYPGDPSGSPENVIQCRCTTIQEIDDSGLISGAN